MSFSFSFFFFFFFFLAPQFAMNVARLILEGAGVSRGGNHGILQSHNTPLSEMLQRANKQPRTTYLVVNTKTWHGAI
jgi:hypothetical protein